MKTKGSTGQPPSTMYTSDAEELGFDSTLIEHNLRLSYSDRIKQATQAANALLKLRSASRLKTRS